MSNRDKSIQRINTKLLHLIKIFELKIYFNIMYCTISLHMYMWYCKCTYVYIVVEQEWNERNPQFCQPTKAARWKAEKRNLHVLTRSRFPTRVDQASETREKARKREAEKPLSAAPRERRTSAVGVGTETFSELSLIHNKDSFLHGIYLLSYNIRRTLYGVKN